MRSRLTRAPGDPTRRNPSSSSPISTAEAIEVTRNSPMIEAPATIRRSVSDEIATPMTE